MKKKTVTFTGIYDPVEDSDKIARHIRERISVGRVDPFRAIMIRNVPESLRRELKAKAASEGKSLQQVLVELIEKYVGKAKL